MNGEILMSDFRNHLARMLENPEFQKEYENGKAEYEVTRALVAARIEQNLTQAQLAERSGVRQSNMGLPICRKSMKRISRSRLRKRFTSPFSSTTRAFLFLFRIQSVTLMSVV